MKALEARSFAEGVSAEHLMEEAGLKIAHAVTQFIPCPGVCLAVFGRGNNGGDALVAARHLAADGWKVWLLPAFAEKEWAELPAKKFREAIGCKLADPTALRTLRPSIVLDGLLGIGARGGLREPIATLARGINTLRASGTARVFALDLPTGLDGDTGVADPACIVADFTLAIGCAKTGLLTDSATNYVGRLAVLPLAELTRRLSGDAAAPIVATPGLFRLLPRRRFDSHKGDYGRVGIIAGSHGYLGAAVLCASACVHTGAGLVTLYSTQESAAQLALLTPPEVMVQSVAALTDVLTRRHDVLAIGPGLGTSRTAEILHIIEHATAPVVVDADALNALATGLDTLHRAGAERILTPHPGEMERLAPCSSKGSRAETVAAFTRRFPRATLLLKGARTLIGRAGEPHSYNTTGNPGMATGGMGDVLTGVIAALLGQHLRPYDAARLGAWLCGRAAEIAITNGESEQTLTPTRLLDFLAHTLCEDGNVSV